jgi:hypothetical protein
MAMVNKRKSVFSKLLLSGILGLLLSPQAIGQQAPLDGRLLGNWLKVGSGDNLRFLPNGDLSVSFSGQATSFSGVGSVERCTDGGSNVCLVGPRFKCAYRYNFTGEGLNLQFRSGSPDVACRAAAGDFRRTEP